MYNIKPFTKLTKYIVNAILICGIVTTVAIPFMIPKLIKMYNLNDTLTIPTIASLLVCGILAVYILNQIRVMLNTIFRGNPFVKENVVSFKKMAIAAFIIALVFIIKLFYWFTYATISIIAVFVVAGLLSMTLMDIFEQAVQYKEDNDLTI